MNQDQLPAAAAAPAETAAAPSVTAAALAATSYPAPQVQSGTKRASDCALGGSGSAELEPPLEPHLCDSVGWAGSEEGKEGCNAEAELCRVVSFTRSKLGSLFGFW